MWNNYGATVPQPQPSVQVCSMVVRVPSEQEGRAFLVQRGLTQIMTNPYPIPAYTVANPVTPAAAG